MPVLRYRSIKDSAITAYSGRIGGKKTAKRGPEYFRKIAAMRKNRKGGRPKKNETGVACSAPL